jgi:hypothetical protein
MPAYAALPPLLLLLACAATAAAAPPAPAAGGPPPRRPPGRAASSRQPLRGAGAGPGAGPGAAHPALSAAAAARARRLLWCFVAPPLVRVEGGRPQHRGGRSSGNLTRSGSGGGGRGGGARVGDKGAVQTLPVCASVPAAHAAGMVFRQEQGAWGGLEEGGGSGSSVAEPRRGIAGPSAQPSPPAPACPTGKPLPPDVECRGEVAPEPAGSAEPAGGGGGGGGGSSGGACADAAGRATTGRPWARLSCCATRVVCGAQGCLVEG